MNILQISGVPEEYKIDNQNAENTCHCQYARSLLQKWEFLIPMERLHLPNIPQCHFPLYAVLSQLHPAWFLSTISELSLSHLWYHLLTYWQVFPLLPRPISTKRNLSLEKHLKDRWLVTELQYMRSIWRFGMAETLIRKGSVVHKVSHLRRKRAYRSRLRDPKRESLQMQ